MGWGGGERLVVKSGGVVVEAKRPTNSPYGSLVVVERSGMVVKAGKPTGRNGSLVVVGRYGVVENENSLGFGAHLFALCSH